MSSAISTELSGKRPLGGPTPSAPPKNGSTRERVEESARLLGFDPVRAENLIAQTGDVASVLEREIANCDTYVGLFSKRRGTVPGGESWAITEQEFLRARQGKLRCLAFLDREADAEREPELARFLDEHVHPYRGGVYPRPYGSEEERRVGVTSTLSALRPEVVLRIGRAGDVHTGRLFLYGVQPALGGGREEIGPFPFDPDLSPTVAQILELFLAPRPCFRALER